MSYKRSQVSMTLACRRTERGVKDRKSTPKPKRKPEAANETPSPTAAESTLAEVAEPSNAAAAQGDGADLVDATRAADESQPPGARGAEPESSEQAEDLPPLDEVDVLRVERDTLQDKLLRLAAEYDNFRKRSAREWQDHRKRAAADVMREMLEICDNLERALETDASDDAGGLRKGVELIQKQFHAFFKRFGIEAFDAEGQPFDPHKHEAVQMVESEEVESQYVVNVVQRGYTLHGEVLRPARVVVSK